MKSTVIIFRELNKAMTYPFILLSAAMIIIYSLSIEGSGFAINTLAAFLIPSFIIYYLLKNTKYAFACAAAITTSDIILYKMTYVGLSLVVIVLFSLIGIVIFRKTNLIFGYLISLLLFSAVSFTVGKAYPNLYEGLKSISKVLSDKAYFFGTVNSLYELFVSDSLAYLFYHTGISKALLINGSAISGAVDIFKADNNASVVSKYLTGKYFVNIFLILGTSIPLINKLHEKSRLSLVLIVILAIIFGDTRLFSLFILMYNPLVYAVYLVLVTLSYLIASLLNISIGFNERGTFFELIKYIDKPIFFIMTGLILLILSCFLTKYILTKFDYISERYYPKNVKEILNALGGADNIEAINDEGVNVYNPNLINILKLDCDIHQNVVTLYGNELEIISEYL